MSRALHDLHRRKFPKLLERLRDIVSRTDDAAFLQMAWAVNLLQSASEVDVRPYLVFPEQAAATSTGSAYLIHKWEIETSILLLLTTPKYVLQPGLNKLYDCRQFETMWLTVNHLRSVADSEYAASAEASKIMLELHRVGQRQFQWQRGFATLEILYRFAFIFGQGNCANYFQQSYGLTIMDFLKVGFLLFVQLGLKPWQTLPNFQIFEIDQTVLNRALLLLSRSVPEMRIENQTLLEKGSIRKSTRIAYWPSALRRFPIVRSSDFRSIIP